MKKVFILLVCNSLFSLSVFAQTHRIGEAFIKDGVPCVIIHVDESGEHGLAMSLTPTPKALQTAKKTGEYKWFYNPRKIKGKERKLILECRTEYYNRFKCDTLRVRTSNISTANRTVTSLSGKENMKNVIDYCNDKGISMEMYFGEYYWAQNLGDGWFIPGAEELEMFIKIYGYEALGSKNSQGIIKLGKNIKAASKTFLSFSDIAPDDLLCFMDAIMPDVYTAICSSTMVNNGKMSASLILMPMIQKITGKRWFDMWIAASSYIPTVAYAVCEF